MRLSLDNPFISYSVQALSAGGAISIACLIYSRAAKAFESDKTAYKDKSHVLKGVTIAILSAAVGTSAHFLGASVNQSGSLAAIVGVSLTIFERFREKGGSSPPTSPPTPPPSTQSTTPPPTTPHPNKQPPPFTEAKKLSIPTPAKQVTTSVRSSPTPPPSTQSTTASPLPQPPTKTPPPAEKKIPNPFSPKKVTPSDQVPPVSVKAKVNQLEDRKSPPRVLPFVATKHVPIISIMIETEVTIVEPSKEVNMSLSEDDDVDNGDPPTPPQFNEPYPDKAGDSVKDPQQLALIETLKEFDLDEHVVDGEEEGWEETSQWTEEESDVSAHSTNLSDYSSLLTNVKGLGLGDDKVGKEEEAADGTEVESSATLNSTDELSVHSIQHDEGSTNHLVTSQDLPEDPIPTLSTISVSTTTGSLSAVESKPLLTRFEKICAEVIKTEKIFVTNLRIYLAKLEAVKEKTHPQDHALKGLNQLIAVCEEFLTAGIPQVYLNLSLMTRYIQALEVMTKNYIHDFHDDAILPVQRGPRHELFLGKLSQQDSQYQVAFDHIKKLFCQINNAPKLAQLNSLTQTLEKLLEGEKKKTLNKIVKKEPIGQFVPATYELVERSQSLFKKTSRSSTNTLVTEDEKDLSIPSLHNILDFLASLPDTIPEFVIQRPQCITLLEKSKWWDKFSKKDKTGDIDGKTLKVKLQALKEKSKPKKL